VIRFPNLGTILCRTRLVNHLISCRERSQNGWQCGVLKRSRKYAWSLPDELLLIVLGWFLQGFSQIIFGGFGCRDCDCLWANARLAKRGRDLVWISWIVSYAGSKDRHAT
jgi:hypothetical protein